MAYPTTEQVEKARQASLADFFIQNGYETERSRNELHIKGYGGLYVNVETNEWYCFSQADKHGGRNAIMNMLESVVNRKSQTLNLNDILPVPSELVPIPANLARVKIDCYLTAVNPKTADYHLEKLPANEYDRLFKLVTGYFDCNDGYCHRITGEYIPPRAAFFDDGRKMVEFLRRYGAPHWYNWCRQNWGQAENLRITVCNHNRLVFDTDTAPSSKIVEKLAELYPSVEIRYRWASWGGRFAGAASYENGYSISEQVFLPFSEEARQIEMLLFPIVFRANQNDDCEQPEPI